MIPMRRSGQLPIPKALPPWPGRVAGWSSPDAAPRQANEMATSAGGDLEAGLAVEQGRQPHYSAELGAEPPEAAWGELDNC